MQRTSRAPSIQAPRTQVPSQRSWWLLASMLAAIAAVTLLAWWDEQREAEAALYDLGGEQSVLASSLAADLRRMLLSGSPSAVVELGPSTNDLVDRGQGSQADAPLVLVGGVDDATLRATDGRRVPSTVLRDAIDHGASTLRLGRPEAAELGLPARTAMAGIARVQDGAGRKWVVVSVASAARERDREKKAVWRLVLGVLVASGLVLAFGGAALRRQRRQLELQQELAVAEAQRESGEKLLRAERVATMGTFALGIAHEVSTPLGVIVGRAEQLLGRAQGDERLTRGAQAILKQADRIQHIVRRFLDMARGKAPSMELIDPAQVVRAAVAAVDHRFARAHVQLTADIPATMPLVQCDRDLLEHAVVNLLLNACEACESGGHVTLAARSDAKQVGFVVTDDGEGISAEAAARAAEPFFTTKAEGAGTGLGLAIASEIVKSHRGELVIGPNSSDSTGPSRGTRARIEIPVAPVGGATAEGASA
jgi:two-component system NtrC family sensor kinase